MRWVRNVGTLILEELDADGESCTVVFLKLRMLTCKKKSFAPRSLHALIYQSQPDEQDLCTNLVVSKKGVCERYAASPRPKQTYTHNRSENGGIATTITRQKRILKNTDGKKYLTE